MKKTFVFLSLLTTISTFALKTKGFIESENKLEFKIYKYDGKTTSTNNLKGEVKIENSGFSTGFEIKTSDATLKKDDSKIWAKYEFPKFYGISTSLKAETKLDFKTKLEVEASKAVIKNLDLTAKITYDATKLVDADRSLNAELGTKYKGIKDVELGLKVFGGSNIDKKEHNVGAEFNGKVTAIPSTEIKLMVKAKDEIKNKEHTITTEIKPEVKYSKNSVTAILKMENEVIYNLKTKDLKWKINPEVSVQYDYKPINTVIISPKLALGVNQKKENLSATIIVPSYITPSLKVEYKPIEKLVLSLNNEFPIDITLKDKKYFSDEHDIKLTYKGQLNIKYSW